MKQFDITYFHGPGADYITNEEVVADIAASGITICQIWRDGDVENNKKALNLIDKYGMKAIIYEKRLVDLNLGKNIEAVDETVRQVVEDYKGYEDIIVGWEVADEPDCSYYPVLSAITEAIHKYAPNQEAVINLYPNYAPVEALGADSYVDYIERFVKEVRSDFISYDHYTFTGRNQQKDDIKDHNLTEKERLIRLAANRNNTRGEFFENIEDVRRIGLENDIEQMMIILVTEHGDYRNLTYAEILWQFNMCLVYGMHRMSYFTYWLPEAEDFWKWDNALCDREGNKFQHYYDVQKINKNLQPVGQMLFEHTSKEVFHIKTGESAVREFGGYDFIESIDGEHGVVGFFEDGYAYLVNHDFAQERTFVIKAGGEMEMYHNPAAGVKVNATEGSLWEERILAAGGNPAQTGENGFAPCGKDITITLEPGAGVVLRVV